MKKYRFLAAALAAALLCGCSDKGDSSQVSTISVVPAENSSEAASGGGNSDTVTSSEPVESTATSASGPVSEPEPDLPAGDETFLVGLAGDRIRKSDITKVFTADGEGSPDDLTEDNFSAVLCNGFIYVAESSGEARNDRDNADVYDVGNMEFTDMSSAPVKDYVRLEVGETLCGLTLTEAEVNFALGSEQMSFTLEDGSVKTGADLGLPEIYFSGGAAKFDGELVMTGYICCMAEDEYGIGVGDILFVPCDGEGIFPITSYRLDGDNGFHHRPQVYAHSDLVWQNDFGYMYLGNSYDTSADISLLPDDGSFIKAQVTVNSLELTCGLNFVNQVRAELVDISETW